MLTLSSLTFLHLNLANAEGIEFLANPVSLTAKDGTGVEALHHSVLVSSTFAMKCAPIQQIQGGYLCLSNRRTGMNQALLRIGVYWGAGAHLTPGSLISDQSPKLRAMEKGVYGHNLPGDVVLSFYAKMDQESAQYPMTSREKEFRGALENVSQIAHANGQFYLIAVDANIPDYRFGVSHEIKHAQAYLTPGAMNAFKDFWLTQVREQDKTLVRKTLSPMYNTENEPVMWDEFQAYLLEDNARNDWLAFLVTRYRARLQAAIK